MAVRAKRLRKTVQHLVDHPDNWDQATWVRVPVDIQVESAEEALCQTQGCLAGWALMRSPRYTVRVQVTADHRPRDLVIYRPDETRVSSIEEEAKKYLGLTQTQANELFAGTSLSMQDFLAKITRITGVDVTDIKPTLAMGLNVIRTAS